MNDMAMNLFKARFFLRVAFVMLVLASHADAADRVVKLDPSNVRVELMDAGDIFEDPEGKLTLDEIRKLDSAGRFAPGVLVGSRSRSAFWFHFRIENLSGESLTRWLEVPDRRWRDLSIFVADSMGNYKKQRVTSEQRFSERPLPTAQHVFAVQLAPQGVTDVYLRCEAIGLSALSLNASLWKPEVYAANAASAKDQWVLYMGLAGALFLLNLLVWLSTREVNYLYYIVSLLSVIWMVGSANGGQGYTFEYLWPNFPLFEKVSWTGSSLAAIVAISLFINHFVDLRRKLPRWSRLTMAFLIMASFLWGYRTTFLLFESSYNLALAKIVQISGLVTIAIGALALLGGVYRLAIQSDRSAQYIAVAWTPSLLLGITSSVSAVLGIGALTTAFMWGSAFELVTMSWALADRFKRERLERERAQASEAMAQAALVDELKRSERELDGKVRQRTAELAAEQAKTRQLLTNMLPEQVIQELTETGKVEPAEHRSATILFTDLAGFTQATATMPADRMVGELNDIFAAFDDITREEGVEKIKTIGDAYMAVAGISSTQPDHAERCVRAALRMQAFMTQRNEDAAFKWNLRVGLHSGPVVSGVVGKHKYAFDIWGDAVNIASRMESSGEVGRVNVSAYTYDLVRKAFDCTYRGKIAAKGKGEIDMYFVERAKTT